MPPPSEGLFKRLPCKAVDATTRNCFSIWDERSRAFGTPETIAGVNIRNMIVTVSNDSVDMIYLIFDSGSFEQVRDALREKYPKLKCQRSDVSNAMGARFDQQECDVRSVNGTISLSQRSGKVTESSLSMYSDTALARISRDRKKNASDL